MENDINKVPEGEEMPQAEPEPTDEEISEAIKDAGKVSPLDPGFLLVFFLVALPADLLDAALDTIGLPSVIGKIVGMGLDLGTFAIIFLWARGVGKNFKMPDNLKEKMGRLDQKVAKKIESKIAQKIGNKISRRTLIRFIPALIIEELPITGIFASWMASVISMIF